MRAFLAALAVVWTLLLGTIAFQLRQINEHLSWVSGPIRGLAAIGREAEAQAKTETREQRIERRVREMTEGQDEQTEILSRVLTGDRPRKSPTAKPSR